MLNKEKLGREVSYLLDIPIERHPRVGKAYSIITTIVQTMIAALQRGETVNIRGFGIFKLHTRPARKNFNAYPFNGKPPNKHTTRVLDSLPPKTQVIFKPSKALIRYINGT